MTRRWRSAPRARWRTVTVVAVACVIVSWWVDPVWADNCGTPSDCFGTAGSFTRTAWGLIVLSGLSLLLDLLPGVGTAKGAVEAFTGRDLLTGQELAPWERALGIVPGIAALAAVGVVARAGRGLGEVADVGRAADRVGDAVQASRRAGPPRRPSWRQSELDADEALRAEGYRPQVSFKDGVEVPYGTRGSSRPDHYRPGSSIEVKNYDVQTAAGRSRLVRNAAGQARARHANLPPGTRQEVVVDVRGQQVDQALLDDLARRISEASDGAVSVDQIRFRR